MNVEFLAEVGQLTAVHFWAPLAAWTVVGLLVLGLLRLVPPGYVRLHHDARMALLLALPAGLALSFAVPFADVSSFSSWLPELVVQGKASASSNSPGPSVLALVVGALSLGAAGAALFSLCRLALGAIALRRLILHSTQSADPAFAQELDAVRQTLGLHQPVRLLMSSATTIPFATGILQPVVVLPAYAIPGRQLRLILLHELAHIANGDVRVALFGRLVSSLFAFHPLAGLLQRSADFYREASCDGAVLGHADRREYAETLFSFVSARPSVPVLAMTSTPSQLNQRIQAMTHSPLRFPGSKLIAFCLLAAATVFTACSDTSSNAVEADAPVAKAMPAAKTYNSQDLPDVMPAPVGGMEAIANAISYPKEASLEGGRVVVGFVVDTDGSVRDAQIGLSAGDLFDAEALSVINGLQFTPGMKDGKPVPVELKLPITFKAPGASN